MLHSVNHRFPVRIVLLALIGALGCALFWSGPVAYATEGNHKGRIDAMPAGTLLGRWVVAGVSFDANGSTEFRTDKGDFAVGVCVEVEYVGAAQPFVATKIASKNADDCTGSGGTPTGVPTTATPAPTTSPTTSATPGGTASPSVTPNPGAEQEVYGLVESKPTTGFIGLWRVNGVNYNAPAGAEFKQRSGPLVIGACVKIHYFTNTNPFTVRELETEQASDCTNANATPNATVSATPSATVSATPGAIGTPVATGELYGVLQSFPAGLVGNWNIGGMTFVAGANTEFKQQRGAFAVGVTVKVHFSIDSAGVNQAREIETKFANDSGGSDDDGNGSFEGAEGHAFGQIDSFPAGLSGQWQIGGILYNTAANTIFAQNDGAFAVGVRVKVEYYLDAQGGRLARKIESTNDNGGATAPTRFKLFGFVNSMPANGRIGAWVVDNIAFVTTGATQFKATNGLLGIGAYVAVEYAIQGGQNQVHEIETHVPPGAGAQTSLGRIDNKGGAVTAAGLQATTWTIGGINYQITPATDLNDVQSALDVGKAALVNSYTAPDGSQVATLVRGITAIHTMNLPVIRR
ncbi:MAG: hypothetical protein DYG89_37685 [Caldilinea sp. CFX5]|nr:hypothetical protein [Caldilinea sp. CFX5]